MPDLYQSTVEIVEDTNSADSRVLGRYSFSTFANSEEEARAKVVAEWQQWLLAPGTSFMVSRMRRIVNGTLEGTGESRR